MHTHPHASGSALAALASVAAGLVLAAPAAPTASAAPATPTPSTRTSSTGTGSTNTASDGVDFTGTASGRRSVARRPAPKPTQPGQSGSGTALLKLASTSFFYDDISKAPLAPDSAAIVANLANQVASHWGGTAAFNAHAWNTTYYRVTPTTPRVDVTWSNCLKFSWTPDGIYTGAKVFKNVPIPANAVAASGSDGSMTIYDAQSDTAWEFWQMKKTASGGWAACQGGRIDTVSKANGQFPTGFGVSASGLSVAAGTISAAEAKAGRIDHAMYLTVVDARFFDKFSWPAVRSDGYTKDATAPMEGQRFRLDPSIDVDKLQISSFAKTVAKAAQKYGFIVCDKGGAVALVGEAGQSLKATTGTDPWPAILGSEDYEALRGFPWNRLQALPKDYGKR